MNEAATTIAPWLSVRNSARAVDFYKAAFGATEAFRMDEGGSVVARLSVEGAEFWVGDESPEHSNFSPETLEGSSVRIILTALIPTRCLPAPFQPERLKSFLWAKNMAGAWAESSILSDITGRSAGRCRNHSSIRRSTAHYPGRNPVWIFDSA